MEHEKAQENTINKLLAIAGLELVNERYVTETGQIVNPGVSKAVWDRVLLRSGFDPAQVVEYNSRGD